jgi:hypothetical protein
MGQFCGERRDQLERQMGYSLRRAQSSRRHMQSVIIEETEDVMTTTECMPVGPENHRANLRQTLQGYQLEVSEEESQKMTPGQLILVLEQSRDRRLFRAH